MASGLDSIATTDHGVNLTDTGNSTDQYLTFMLAGEEYGVQILSVQEIRGWDSATKIPNMPSYVRGVINLRGNIVPIVDLRERFNIETIDYSRTTVVIVLRVAEAAEGVDELAMGLIVDAVSDVYKISPDQLKPVPDFASGLDGEIASGIATVDDKMIIILDIAHLLSHEVISTAQNQASKEKDADGS